MANPLIGIIGRHPVGHVSGHAQSKARDISLLAVVAGAIALVALLMVRFSAPTPGLLDHARVFAATGRETMPFFKTGDVVMLAAGLLLEGEHGIIGLQAIAYIADALLAYVLVISAGGSRRAAIAAGLILAVHPYLVFNIKRIVDNNLAIPALLIATFDRYRMAKSGTEISYRARRGNRDWIRDVFAVKLRAASDPYRGRVCGARELEQALSAAAIAIAIVLTGNRVTGGYGALAVGGRIYFLYRCQPVHRGGIDPILQPRTVCSRRGCRRDRLRRSPALHLRKFTRSIVLAAWARIRRGSPFRLCLVGGAQAGDAIAAGLSTGWPVDDRVGAGSDFGTDTACSDCSRLGGAAADS